MLYLFFTVRKYKIFAFFVILWLRNIWQNNTKKTPIQVLNNLSSPRATPGYGTNEVALDSRGGTFATMAFKKTISPKGELELQVYESLGISLVEVFKTVGKSFISVCIKAQETQFRCIIRLWKRSAFAIW